MKDYLDIDYKIFLLKTLLRPKLQKSKLEILYLQEMNYLSKAFLIS